MSEIWKTIDGTRRFLIPDGIELCTGSFQIIDESEQYDMRVKEDDVIPYEIEYKNGTPSAEDIVSDIIGEACVAFSELFQDLSNVLESEEIDGETNANKESKASTNISSEEWRDDMRATLNSEMQGLISGLQDIGKELVDVLRTRKNKRRIAKLGWFLQEWAEKDILQDVKKDVKKDVQKENKTQIFRKTKEEENIEHEEFIKNILQDQNQVVSEMIEEDITVEKIENMEIEDKSSSFSEDDSSEDDSYTMDDDFEDTVVRVLDFQDEYIEIQFQDATIPRIDQENQEENQEEKSMISVVATDFDTMTKSQLLDFANEKGIVCKNSWNKAKIIETIQSNL